MSIGLSFYMLGCFVSLLIAIKDFWEVRNDKDVEIGMFSVYVLMSWAVPLIMLLGWIARKWFNINDEETDISSKNSDLSNS